MVQWTAVDCGVGGRWNEGEGKKSDGGGDKWTAQSRVVQKLSRGYAESV